MKPAEIDQAMRGGHGLLSSRPLDRVQPKLREGILVKDLVINRNARRRRPRMRQQKPPLLSFRAVIALGAALFCTVGAAAPGGWLSAAEARTKAIRILTGDPYGKTPRDSARAILHSELLLNGITKACGATNRAAWEFHVVVRTGKKDYFKNGLIDGYLALDARSGEILCTNLPLLD
jgi:hypothetical protein